MKVSIMVFAILVFLSKAKGQVTSFEACDHVLCGKYLNLDPLLSSIGSTYLEGRGSTAGSGFMSPFNQRPVRRGMGGYAMRIPGFSVFIPRVIDPNDYARSPSHSRPIPPHPPPPPGPSCRPGMCG